jgi:platelet-activating factor acetylhydrolase IB subunit alpha
VVFHPLGSHLYSVSDDKTCRIWDLKAGRCIKVLYAHPHFVTCVDINRSGVVLLATGSVDQTVRIFGT